MPSHRADGWGGEIPRTFMPTPPVSPLIFIELNAAKLAEQPSSTLPNLWHMFSIFCLRVSSVTRLIRTKKFNRRRRFGRRISALCGSAKPKGGPMLPLVPLVPGLRNQGSAEAPPSWRKTTSARREDCHPPIKCCESDDRTHARKVGGREVLSLLAEPNGTVAVLREWTDQAPPSLYSSVLEPSPILQVSCLLKLPELVPEKRRLFGTADPACLAIHAKPKNAQLSLGKAPGKGRQIALTSHHAGKDGLDNQGHHTGDRIEEPLPRAELWQIGAFGCFSLCQRLGGVYVPRTLRTPKFRSITLK